MKIKNTVACTILFALLITMISACSSVDISESIGIHTLNSELNSELFLRSYQPYGFIPLESRQENGGLAKTLISPDDLMLFQTLDIDEQLQSARILTYLPIEASYEYASYQYSFITLMLQSIFPDGSSEGVENWVIETTNSLTERSNTSLMGGATQSMMQTTDVGELAVSLFVKLDEEAQGVIIAVVIGDWMDDFIFDANRSAWSY